MVRKVMGGFSLVEIMLATLLSVFLSVAATEWYLSVISVLRAQQMVIENNEVGHFVLRYLDKSLRKAGAGLQDKRALYFDNGDLVIRYTSGISEVPEIKNCLANSVDDDVISDRFSIEIYEFGGRELKCSSNKLSDWISEGVKDISFEVAVDQGAFIYNEFDYSIKDGLVDGYVSAASFDQNRMDPLAVRLTVVTYRSISYSPFNRSFWAEFGNWEEEHVSQSFSSIILLPNA